MTICKTCGAKIDFIRSPKGGKIPVAAHAGYYIPVDAGTAVFVTAKGEVRKGREVTDGIKGHLLHKCGRR